MTNLASNPLNFLQHGFVRSLSEEEHRCALPLAFFLVGSDRQVLRCEGATSAITGFVANDLVGKNIASLFRGNSDVLSGLARAYSGEISIETVTVGGLTRELCVLPASNAKIPNMIAVLFRPVQAASPRFNGGHLNKVLDRISEGVLAVNLGGHVVDANRAAEEILGFSRAELLQNNLENVIPEAVLGGAVDETPKNLSVICAKGIIKSLCVSVFSTGFEEKLAATVLFTSTDSAKEKESQSDKRYELLAAGVNDGLWEWNLEDGTVYFSARWRSLLGLEKAVVKHTPESWLSRIHPDDVEVFCSRFDAHLDGESSIFEHEYRMRHANGDFRWVRARGIAARRDSGQPYLMAGSQSDITDRKLAEENVTHGSLHDALTGLPNRGLMLDRIGQALARLKRNEQHRFALAIFDLDRFLVVNESLGHAAGDALLVSLARRLESVVASGNTLARLGGDEFAILIEDYESPDEINKYIHELQSVVSQPFDINGEEVFVSASFGVATGAPKYKRSEELLRDADLAMYRAKKDSKSGFETFDEQRHRRSVNQLQIEAMLRRALDNGDIVVHYQPIVDLRSGKISGFEALTRLNHPTNGLVPPSEFIGIAEETGLIVPLSEQVLKKACIAAGAWQRRFGLENQLSMSVNFSARHISEDNIVELLKRSLRDSRLPPEDLKIEITESLIMTNPELAAQTFAQIKELGVTLSLDDFGTGYSSLSYLRRFPIDTLKMDRSFVSRMDTDEKDMELVRMIIMLAHTLGMVVIGEGIESDSQLGLLRNLNCEFGQGYFFAKPLTEDAAAGMLAAPPVWR